MSQNFIIYLLLFLILYILIKILQVKITYRPIFEWWNSNGGNSYNISIFNIYAAYSDWITYSISRFNSSPVNTLSIAQNKFFVEKLMKYSYWTDENGKGSGILMPVHIAKSVKLELGQGIEDFDLWYKAEGIWEYNTLPKNNDPWSKDKNPNGVYPEDNDISGWKEKIANWAGSTSEKFWTHDNQSNLLIPNVENANIWIEEWQKVDNHPDNFIGKCGITPDSPLIIAFINGKYNDPKSGIILNAQSFTDLLTGGWINYLQGSSNLTFDQYVNFLYTSYSVLPNPPPKSCGDSASSGIAAWGTAITTALGIGLMAVFAPAAAPGLIASAVVAGGLSIGSHYAKIAECKKQR